MVFINKWPSVNVMCIMNCLLLYEKRKNYQPIIENFECSE